MSLQAAAAAHPAVPGYRPALPLVAGALADVLAPPAPLVPSTWAAANLVVPDGPRAGGDWDPELTPYVGEIIDALGPDSPHNFVAVRKSAQTGVSVGGIALVAAYADQAPCRMAYVLPTIDALQEFNREKLSPVIEQTPALRAKVKPQTSRSASGSTTTSKKFPGGSLVLINANSAADLRSKTLKVGVADEVDEWADDLDGQGDPLDLLEARFIAFHGTADWRLLAISTPTLAGSSRIDGLFKTGDQRFWHIRCPQCGEEIALEFRHLRFEDRPPYRAHYAASCCGYPIAHAEKGGLVRSGRFVATNPDGLYPSFHVDALVSQLTTWDMIADNWTKAKGDERREKSFWNLVLGLPYEQRGDAPDHVRLMERREDYIEGHVPARGLLLVAGADVQHSGLWVEIVAFAADRQTWCVSARWLEGDTTDPERGAWRRLSELYEERFPDAFGGLRTLDGIAVDAGDGGRVHQVCAWTRGRPKAFAVKGMPGWTHPPIGTPTKVDINRGGRRIRRGAYLWPVGTWALKGEFYSHLRKDGLKAGKEIDPPGYCHFGEFLDEQYFRQITAEYVITETYRGRSRRAWKQAFADNHLLDCRVYAMAMAEHLGLTRMTQEDWSLLALQRGVPAEARRRDLLSPEPVAIAARAAEKTGSEREQVFGAVPIRTQEEQVGVNRPGVIRSRWMGR